MSNFIWELLRNTHKFCHLISCNEISCSMLHFCQHIAVYSAVYSHFHLQFALFKGWSRGNQPSLSFFLQKICTPIFCHSDECYSNSIKMSSCQRLNLPFYGSNMNNTVQSDNELSIVKKPFMFFDANPLPVKLVPTAEAVLCAPTKIEADNFFPNNQDIKCFGGLRAFSRAWHRLPRLPMCQVEKSAGLSVFLTLSWLLVSVMTTLAGYFCH